MRAMSIRTFVSTEMDDWYVQTLWNEYDGEPFGGYETHVYTYDKIRRTAKDLVWSSHDGPDAHLAAVAHLIEHGTPPKEDEG